MDMSRRSIGVPGVTHGATPIPLGCRIADIAFSSAIPGIDASTEELPAAPHEQVHHVFRNVRAFLDAAGMTTADVVRVSFAIDDDALRREIDAGWVELFPDAGSRPARHTTVGPLRLGMHVQAELVAVASTSASILVQR